MSILSKHAHSWGLIEAPSYVKKWLNEGVEIPFSENPPMCKLDNYKLTTDQNKFVDNKIIEYVSNHYISKVNYVPHCVSPIGCVKKSSGDKFRFINDMRFLNQFINTPNVRYEDLRSTISDRCMQIQK